MTQAQEQAEALAYYKGLSEGQAARIAALEAENARLREALKWLSEMAGYAKSYVAVDWKYENGRDLQDALDKARAVLGGAK